MILKKYCNYVILWLKLRNVQLHKTVILDYTFWINAICIRGLYTDIFKNVVTSELFFLFNVTLMKNIDTQISQTNYQNRVGNVVKVLV